MAKKQKKHGRNSYLNDFRLNVAGEYIYDGALYACRDGADGIRAAQRRVWTAGALLVLAAVLGGCIPAPGMQNHFYVILPYLGELTASLTVFWALVRLGRSWTSVREYVYERTVPALPRRAMAAAVCALLGAAAEGVHLVLSGAGGQVFPVALYFLLKLLAAASALTIRRAMILSNWDKVSKNGDC